jgi:Flp pilus assembly protein TadD
MNNFRILLLSLFLTTSLFAQTEEDKILELVKEGVQHHDSQEYNKAILKYKEALSIDKKSPLANYELAMTYSEKGDFPQAIKYAKKVIKQNTEYVIPAYMVKGNVLDEQGRTRKSIKLFNKAIRETEGHYLLHYNLGINYFKEGDLDAASSQMINAIKRNPTHTSSHLYLALAQKRKDELIKSLLPLYYFLLLEPNSNRAENAYVLLQSDLYGDVSRDAYDETQVNIVIDDSEDNPYRSVELMINLMAAARFSDENKDLSNEQYFVVTTKGIFEHLATQEIEAKDIWSDFYIPFFKEVKESKHFETFTQYVMQGTSDLATEWIAFHPDEVEEFFFWLNEGRGK